MAQAIDRALGETGKGASACIQGCSPGPGERSAGTWRARPAPSTGLGPGPPRRSRYATTGSLRRTTGPAGAACGSCLRLRGTSPGWALVRELRFLRFGIFDPSHPAQQDQQDPYSWADRGQPDQAGQAPSPRTARRSACRPRGRSRSKPFPPGRRRAGGCAAGPHSPGGSGRAGRWRASPGVRGYSGGGQRCTRCGGRRGPPGRHAGGPAAGRRFRAVQAAHRMRGAQAPPRTPRGHRSRGPAAHLVGDQRPVLPQCPAQDHLNRLHLPRDASTARARSAARPSMPG